MHWSEMTWFWVSLPYATFGVAEQGGVVRHAAPIAGWARGKQIGAVPDYYRRKGAEIVRLP